MRTALLTLAVAALVAGCGGTVRESASAELDPIDGDTLDFSGTLAGTDRARRVVLRNGSGGSDFEDLTGIRIGIDGAGLQVEHDCPATLGSKEACTVRVIAAPQVAGALAGTLTVASSDGTLRRGVTGTAVAALDPAGPALQFQTGVSGDVGSVPTDETVTRSVDIVNRGSGAGRATVALSAPDGGWTATHDCDRSIPPLGRCTVTLVFAPPEASLVEATLTFTDLYRNGYAPARLPLRGTGTAP
jgi:Abnormal spindle-like microcephaly-assoc'd, ASPM-SPD-2-Hydin